MTAESSTLRSVAVNSMVQVIPWSSYTWKSHVDSTKNQITQLEAKLTSSRNDLVRIEKELVEAETLGIADEPLPDNYGETPFREGTASGQEPERFRDFQ